MNESALTAQSLSLAGLALTALMHLALSAGLSWQLLRRQVASRPAWFILLAALFTVLWSVGSLLPLQPERRLATWLLVHVVDVLRYGAWFGFFWVALVQGLDQAVASRRPRWVLPLSLLLTLFALAGGFLGMLLLALFGLILLEQWFRNLPDDSRWNARPLCLGLAGIFLYDSYLFSQAVLFQGIEAQDMAARPIVHGVMGLLLAATFLRGDWLPRVRVSRQLVFHGASLLLAGAYLLLISAAGYYVRYFGGDWGQVLQVALVFIAIILLAALASSRRLRGQLRVVLAKHLFHYRYDYRDEWQKFTHALARHQRPEDLNLSVIRSLADMVESPAGSLWWSRPQRDKEQQDDQPFHQIASWNQSPITAVEPFASPWMRFMRERAWVMNLQEFRQHPERYAHHCQPDWLAQLPQVWLMVPLFVSSEMKGFVLLDQSRIKLDINWEVHDLLKTAARQAASFLAQAQATEALLEARKFEAFNRMSAFVVHDLKNIVTQLSLMAKNARRHGHDPEFQADMLMTVENSLERMRQLMAQLREGAAPAGQTVGVDLAALARELSRQAQARGRRVELRLAADLHTRGQPERLQRIIGHLVHNALDATESGQGRVWIETRRHGSQAVLTVGDQGVGMSPDFIRERLFKPFQSTKVAGMGIGLYECLQYVQELGGKIEVESQPGQGTRMILLLPAMDAIHTSDLQ